MNRNRRSIAGLALALLAAACGQSGFALPGGSETPTTIIFASNVNAEEEAGLRIVLDKFEKESKAPIDLNLATRFRNWSGIEVELRRTRPEERLRELRSGDPAFHLFAEDIVALWPLVDDEQGSLVQPPDGIGIPAGAPDGLSKILEFDSRLMFLPFRLNVRLQYANKEALRDAGVEELPPTPEAFEEAAEKLRKGPYEGRVTLSLSSADGGAPTAVTISELILSQRGEPIDLNSEASVAAFGMLQSWWNNHLLARESLMAKHDTEVGFLEDGVAALAQNWTFTSSELVKAKRLDDFEVRPGWQGLNHHVIGGDALGIPRGVTGRQKDAAHRLAQYLMSREAQSILATENAWPSILPDLDVEEAPHAETLRVAKEVLKHGWYRPNERYWNDPERDMSVTRAMNLAVSRILVGGEPVKAVLDDLQKQVEKANPEYRPKSPAAG